MINGMPKPALMGFTAYKAPHFVQFGFFTARKDHLGLMELLYRFQILGIDRFQFGFFFLCLDHGNRADA